MSIVDDQIRRLDLLLDRFQLSVAKSTPTSPVLLTSASDGFSVWPDDKATSTRSSRLRAIVRALSTTSASHPLLRKRRLVDLLHQAKSLHSQSPDTVQATGSAEDGRKETDMEWIVVGKATVQTYGLIMRTFLEQVIPLSDEIWYWDEILGSYAYTTLYTLQTSPLRLWKQVKEIYADVNEKYISQSDGRRAERLSQSLSERWRKFYSLVQQTVKERSVAEARSKILSPFALCRTEARQKQNGLKKLREMTSSGLGLLVDEGLSFDASDDESMSAKEDGTGAEEWRNTVAKSISLMETILRNVTTLEVGVTDFEDGVFTSVEEDPEIVQRGSEDGPASTQPAQLTDRLLQILNEHLPGQESANYSLCRQYGRPSRLIRYWLPSSILLLSGSTLLRIIANRRAEIITWIRDFGSTVVDFWSNWVIEPVKKLIGTIRHDENSEVAIMSKDSLIADRESLERMVVDFAVDHPDTSTPLTESEVAELRSRVKEGDLTVVLKAYERDLRKPFMGTVRGDLVRALLIQIQKTKVDVEVAIGGIDALLKSQELVFGFVGLTPGILVSFAVFRWLSGVFGNRRGLQQHKKQGELIRILRNIDRILNASQPTPNGMLSYKDHGLLLCEVHVLRQRATLVLPGNIHREFLEDVNDLVEIRNGISRQLRAIERIRWAYSKWLR